MVSLAGGALPVAQQACSFVVPVLVLLREVLAGEARAVLLSMGHRLLLLLLDKSQRDEHYLLA